MHLMSVGLVLLGLEPVRDNGSTLSCGRVLALNLDSHALVLLEATGEVGLFGRDRGLGHAEDLDVALGVGLLDGRGLVALESLEVQLLDKVGCRQEMLAEF